MTDPAYEAVGEKLKRWEFETAAGALPRDCPRTVRSVSRALAAVFGDSGRFGGEMGVVVDATVEAMLSSMGLPADGGSGQVSRREPAETPYDALLRGLARSPAKGAKPPKRKP